MILASYVFRQVQCFMFPSLSICFLLLFGDMFHGGIKKLWFLFFEDVLGPVR